MRLLVVDPGLPDCGVVIYHDGVLTAAAHIKVLHGTRWCIEDRPCPHDTGPAVALASLIGEIYTWAGPHLGGPPDAVVVEWPQIFHRGGILQGTTVQQMLDLAGVAGAVLALGQSQGAEVYRYTPQQWKGNAPKEEHQRLHLCMLTPEEREHLPRMPKAGRILSDPLDAALLGLWWLIHTGRRIGAFYGQPRQFIGQLEEG